MNKEEIKLTEYLHNIIENNMSLRNENDRLWKQKLEYIDRISKAIEYIKIYRSYENIDGKDYLKGRDEIGNLGLSQVDELLEILGGKE